MAEQLKVGIIIDDFEDLKSGDLIEIIEYNIYESRRDNEENYTYKSIVTDGLYVNQNRCGCYSKCPIQRKIIIPSILIIKT